MLKVGNTPVLLDLRSVAWRLVGLLVLLTLPIWWVTALFVSDEYLRGKTALGIGWGLIAESIVLILTGNERDYDENGEEI